MITAEKVGTWEEGSLLIVEYQLKDGRTVLGTSTLRLRPHQFNDDVEMARFVADFLASRERKANEGRDMHEVTRGKTVDELAREGRSFKASQRL